MWTAKSLEVVTLWFCFPMVVKMPGGVWRGSPVQRRNCTRTMREASTPPGQGYSPSMDLKTHLCLIIEHFEGVGGCRLEYRFR